MRLQFLCLLWSVLGHSGLSSDETSSGETKEIEAENEDVLRKLPKNMPEEVRLAVYKRFITMETQLKTVKKLTKNAMKAMKKENDELLMTHALFKERYGNVARGVKTRDWLLEKERVYFPVWLSLLDIGRYVKWNIALYTVDDHYINKLRNELDKKGFKYERFAADMDSMYEKSSESVHNVFGIEKPKTREEINQFCHFFVPNLNEDSRFACEFVINNDDDAENTDSVSTDTPILDDTRSVTPKISTLSTFYIIITCVDVKRSNMDKLHHTIKLDIENIPEFNTEKGVVIQLIKLPENPHKLDDHNKRSKKHLPGFFVKLGVEILFGIGTIQEKLVKCEKYEKLKVAISNKLKLKPELNKAPFFFVDPHYLINDGRSSIDSLSLKESAIEASTMFPTRFFICISNVAQSEGTELTTKFDSVKQLIDNTIKISNIKHTMIDSKIVTEEKDKNPPSAIFDKLTVPGMYFHVGVKLDTNDEKKTDLSKYTVLKSQITSKIQPGDRNGKKEYTLEIIDDPNLKIPNEK